MKQLCNEIYVLFYKWIQIGIKLDSKDLKNMFALLLNGDKRYIRFCPESIEKDIFPLEQIFSKCPEKYKKTLIGFISCCIDVYNFDSIKVHKKVLEMDALYYKASLAQYYIVNFLNASLDINTFTSFKKELYQIGVVINKYYSFKDENQKLIISKMIKSKTDELFRRYNFDYSLPICTQN
ncbi:MAG: hypothetical protein E7E64_05265 [Clostridium celatum]|uniref:hypothetical protein n=1 Tax=Clostridium tertium TaxID=1559 RepID=UPI002902DB5D|nr:hypothetical protein [Clostridium celatum]